MNNQQHIKKVKESWKEIKSKSSSKKGLKYICQLCHTNKIKREDVICGDCIRKHNAN